MEEIKVQLDNLFLLLLLSIGVSSIGMRFGFFRFPYPPKTIFPRWKNLITVFSLFLGTELILVPFVLNFFIHFGHLSVSNPEIHGWLNIASIFILWIVLGLYLWVLPWETRRSVWGWRAHDLKTVGKDISLGILCWLFAFPVVTFLGQLASFGLSLFMEVPHVDQVAVQHLKETLNYPFLFWTTAIAIIGVVPFIEELLFRGFLQNFLIGMIGRWGGIILTAVIFSLFHYAPEQGYNNVELIVSLFVLSCYLGFICERQQSLWASIGLHSFFNAVSVGMIFFGGVDG